MVTAISSGGERRLVAGPGRRWRPGDIRRVFLQRGRRAWRPARGSGDGHRNCARAAVRHALPLTRLANPAALAVDSSGNPLPSPVRLADLPDVSIQRGIAFWEPLEGMLVSAVNGTVVAPSNEFAEFAFLTQADARPGSGFFPRSGRS